MYGASGIGPLQEVCRRNVETVLRMEGGELRRNGSWTESVAVGSEAFVRQVKDDLDLRAEGRKVVDEDDRWVLREPAASYPAFFEPEKARISRENRPF